MLGVLASLDPLRPGVFVLVLSTERRNAFAFLMGWAVALTLLFVGGFFFLGGADMGRASSQQRTSISVVLLVIGVGLLAVATRRSRRAETEPRALVPDAVRRRLDHLDVRQAGLLGALVQPTTLTIAAALVVARDRSGALSLLVGFAVFAAVSTAALVGLLVYDIRHRDESSGWLQEFVDWIERESPRLVTIASALAGSYLVFDALRSLIGS